MTVTDIVSRNKSKSNIFIDGEFAFVLYKGDFRHITLEVDKEISEEVYREIMEEILPKRALDRSYKLLMSKDYTEKQLRGKLKDDGYPEEIIQTTVEELKALKYLDDNRYAENFLFWKAKDRSRNRMMMDLRQKGIDPSVAEKIYDELLEKDDIDDEETVLIRFLEKKHFSPEKSTYEEKEKMKQSLYRKGFSFDSIQKVLGR
jgi:regulatory protein